MFGKDASTVLTRTAAHERAVRLAGSVETGPGYHGRLWDAITADLLAVQTETAKDCATIAEQERNRWDPGRIGFGVAATILAAIQKKFLSQTRV
jgi:hypothetical protein